MKARRRKPHIIRRRTNIRDYSFNVHLSRSTGKLLKIRAGCRTWLSFADALAHYRGDGPYAPSKYRPAHFNEMRDKMVNNADWHIILNNYYHERSIQLECQLLLGKLEGKTKRWQKTWRARHRRRKS